MYSSILSNELLASHVEHVISSAETRQIVYRISYMKHTIQKLVLCIRINFNIEDKYIMMCIT